MTTDIPDFWRDSIWISATDSAVRPESLDPCRDKPEAEDGTAIFVKAFANTKPVVKAWWTVAGLGVFRIFANGAEVGAEDFLKPGFTHYARTKHSFCYDVTNLLKTGSGEENELFAEVSSGWWRDKIIRFRGRRSAFRAVLVLRHPDDTETRICTDTSWLASGAAGPVLHASIFEGEDYDARLATRGARMKKDGWMDDAVPAVENIEFHGDIIPMEGPPIRIRHDLALSPVEAYVWRGVEGADGEHFGWVVKLREGFERLTTGETLILDFGQNCAAVPEFTFSAARGVTLTARPAEMLNDGYGDKARHCDGPGGSAHFAEYRGIRTRARYIFAGEAEETYRPSFTFYGGRYLSVTVEGGSVEIKSVRWLPVSSIPADSETASLETGDPALNRFISNILWGMRSNYISIPTDCPQRGERLGWTADTQVFTKAACYNSSATYPFLRKWMHDMRDSQRPDGGFPGVAPDGLIGANEHQFGWADAGVIVPYTLWRHFGDNSIVRENWDAMSRYVALVEKMKFESPQALEHQWADWLSLEKLETSSGRAYVGGVKNVPPVKEDALTLWRYLGACHWLQDAGMMAEMAKATGRAAEVEAYHAMAARALAHIRANFVDRSDGMLIPLFRDMQTPALFALRLGILKEGPARATRDLLLDNIREHGNCLQTGFLGTAIILDTLVDKCDAPDVAYSLLLQHSFPSWLYSVDQGATTVWESWDAYTVADGFSPGDRSFNHYAYGAIFAWMMSHMAGIREDPAALGWHHFILAPLPDRRVGHVAARYRSPCGEIESAWEYDTDSSWHWRFAVPEGTTATVILPEETPQEYAAGRHEVVRRTRGTF
jgi:alpha-L-rhamnosidase